MILNNLLPNRKTRLEGLIDEMTVEVNKLSCPEHLTNTDLDEINTLIDEGRMTALKFKNAVKQLAIKPPQEVRFKTVGFREFDKSTMVDWKTTKVGYFVEVRVGLDGEYLNVLHWVDIERTDEQVYKLLGIN